MRDLRRIFDCSEEDIFLKNDRSEEDISEEDILETIVLIRISHCSEEDIS